MSNVLDPTTLVLFLFFVVPGFVLVRTYDLIVPSERRNFGAQFIDVIAYSLLLLPFSTALLALVVLNRNWWDSVPWFYFWAFIATLIGVYGIPVFAAWLYYNLRISGFLRGRAIHPPPTSWDWFFEKGTVHWVRFHLKSGEILGGYYGRDSFTTTFPNPQQIYVEEVYELDDEGVFARDPIPGTQGAIITREDCDYIEFLEVPEAQGQGNEQDQEREDNG